MKSNYKTGVGVNSANVNVLVTLKAFILLHMLSEYIKFIYKDTVNATLNTGFIKKHTKLIKHK
jgi:hypothetical protein